MNRSTIRSYFTVAALALSSVFSFAANQSDSTKAASTQPKAVEICQVHPEYSCVEVPTGYGYQSYKEAKQKKADARHARAAQKKAAAVSEQHGN
jgi:hypothetical protein